MTAQLAGERHHHRREQPEDNHESRVKAPRHGRRGSVILHLDAAIPEVDRIAARRRLDSPDSIMNASEITWVQWP